MKRKKRQDPFEPVIANRLQNLWIAEIDAEDETTAEDDVQRELARLTGGTGDGSDQTASSTLDLARDGTQVHIYQLEPELIVVRATSDFDELSLHSVWPLSDALLQWLDDNDTATSVNVVIDLSTIDFIDSTTLGVLVMFRLRLQLLGGWVSLVCPNPGPRQILRMTRLDTAFGVHASMDDALAAIHRYMRGPTSRFTFPR